jgi:hypothetical protein
MGGESRTIASEEAEISYNSIDPRLKNTTLATLYRGLE